MRILHFSDIHLQEAWHRVPWADWASKRLIGGLHLVLGRSRAFANAGAKVAALAELVSEQRIDLVIFTGDYTAMGTRGEFKLARQTVAPLLAAPLGYLHVPGNHDLYVRDVIREQRFEESFGQMLTTDLPEYRAGNGPWPFVRWVGDGLAVVGVNSARPNPQPWRSSGEIPADQLANLSVILRDRRVRERFVFVITHYAPCLEEGVQDSRIHGLANAAAFLEVCRKVEHGAILCGHVHRRFTVRTESSGVPVFCAGSATMTGREGLWVFDCVGKAVSAVGGAWDGRRYVLDESLRVTL